MAANPMYWGWPLFVGMVYGFAYDPGIGFPATGIIGVPITVAMTCVGKAAEIGAV
jgi:hypothetical protein